MNPATINTTTFTLTGPGTTAVTGVVTYASSTATFTPSSPLALNTLYTATITTGAQDLNGDALASNIGMDLHHKQRVLCSPPTVISVAPPNLATGVCPNTLVTATFSEAMTASTINTTTFTLTGPGADRRARSSYLCRVKRCRNLHAHQSSRTRYRLYRHHHHGCRGSRGHSAGS